MTTQPFKTLVLDLMQQAHDDEAAWVQELSETERTAIGAPDLWAAKDHVAHRTFWHQEFIQKLTAYLHRQEAPPSREGDDDQINGRVFEKQRLRSWAELHAESERVYAELLALIEQLSEADLTESNRVPWIPPDKPLYAGFLGSCYEHDQEHIVQYYSDRHDLARAIHLRERCASRILQAQAPVPEWVKGWFLYNLACFYAQQHQPEQAAARLQEALTLAPELQEQSQRDPDLAALREHSA
jgi:tetratricopeptide (TPR) repeat protein